MLARQQPQRWQLKHLPGLDPDHHCTSQLGAAPLAAVRHMPDHLVGLGDLGQMGTGRAGLLARVRRPSACSAPRCLVRAGFRRPSEDGGLEELEESLPRRRSSSATRASSAAIA
jgi:hypothetical protein